jgi:hypothetical protein
VVAVASLYGAPTVLSPSKIKRRKRKKHKEKADPQPPVEVEAPTYDAPTDPVPVKRKKLKNKKRRKDRAAREPPVEIEAQANDEPTVPPPVRLPDSSVMRENEPVSESDARDLGRMLPKTEVAEEAALQDDCS